MDTTSFNDQQKQALVDLLVLGMYSDRRLTLAEDERIQGLLDAFGISSEYAREQFLDASITRISRKASSPETVGTCVAQLAVVFEAPVDRRQVLDLLSDLLESDSGLADEERDLLALVREAFEV
jgi:hypothetical protein